MLKKYDLKDNEEYKEWENLISADKKLHVPITIDGYLSVKWKIKQKKTKTQ